MGSINATEIIKYLIIAVLCLYCVNLMDEMCAKSTFKKAIEQKDGKEYVRLQREYPHLFGNAY